jgi:hypothetical protein
MGHAIAGDLADAMHGEIDPRTLDERAVRQWQAEGRNLLRDHRQGEAAAMADFGRAVRESGLTPDEAAQALAAAMSERGMTAEQATEALRRGELRP